MPDELSVLNEMQYFELQWRGVDLTGTIPSKVGTTWTKLTTFLARENGLSGTFPFVNSPHLERIVLSGNQFEDDVKSLFVSTNLSLLDADDNNFTGSLPSSMTELENLSKINCIFMSMDVPVCLTLLYSAATVRLSNNKLFGVIPNNWTNSSRLQNVHLSSNRLVGSLPGTLANAVSLTELYLSWNMLSGSIPTSFYNMQSLQELYIDSNNFTGTLSQVDEALYDGIQMFAINNNTFEGEFPTAQFEKTNVLSE